MSQKWETLALKTPSLIIGEVEVEVVEFETSHVVDDCFDFGHVEPVTRWICHDAAVLIGRFVFDVDGTGGPIEALDDLEGGFGWEKLKKSLIAPEKAGIFASCDVDDSAVHVKDVLFVVEAFGEVKEDTVGD